MRIEPRPRAIVNATFPHGSPDSGNAPLWIANAWNINTFDLNELDEYIMSCRCTFKL
jgi:hypothetical protein